MNNIHRIVACLLIGLLVSITGQMQAQQPTATTPEMAVPPAEHSGVEAILATNPSDPTAWTRAARLLGKFGRADLARQYLKRVLDAKLDEDALAALAEQLGSPIFIELAAETELQPEGKQLANAVLAAASKKAQDSKRLETLVQQLQDPSVKKRFEALAGLTAARHAGAAYMIAVLADANRSDEHPNIAVALVRMGRDAREPLLGVLTAEDQQLKTHAIRILANMEANQAAVHLLQPAVSDTDQLGRVARAALARLIGSAPSRADAMQQLNEQAKRHFAQSRPGGGRTSEMVAVWRWDEQKKVCVQEAYTANEAACIMAARLAKDAYALAPEVRQVRQLYLATALEEAAIRNGLGRPLPGGTFLAEVSRFGPEVIEDVLAYAMDENHAAAATIAAEVLGRIGTADDLLVQGPRPSPLVRALRNADRRLRLAAAEAIVRLKPRSAFPGSSHLLRSLAYLVRCGGSPRVLIAGPSTEASRELVGMLAAMGFEVDTALSGLELLRMAGESPEYELVLIDVGLDRPTVELVLPRLRLDHRCANLRVGLLARDGFLPRAEKTAGRDPMALAFSRPHSDEAIARQIGELATLAPQSFVSHDERMAQASRALDCLLRISQFERPRFCELRGIEGSLLKALYVPELSTKVIALLGTSDTPLSQQTLVEVASRYTLPLPMRQAASVAFARSTRAKHGILLTTIEIGRQYDRYNQSEQFDVETQQVLARILDAIEAPTEHLRAAAEKAQQPTARPTVQSP